MAKNTHLMKCAAPICLGDKNTDWKKTRVWYPGETVCDKRPLSKIQKNQLEINKLVKKHLFKFQDKYFTAVTLNRLKKIRPEIKGKDPEE